MLYYIYGNIYYILLYVLLYICIIIYIIAGGVLFTRRQWYALTVIQFPIYSPHVNTIQLHSRYYIFHTLYNRYYMVYDMAYNIE